MAAITFTPQQMMLLMLVIETAVKFAMRQIAELSEAELDELIADEELRTHKLMDQLT